MYMYMYMPLWPEAGRGEGPFSNHTVPSLLTSHPSVHAGAHVTSCGGSGARAVEWAALVLGAVGLCGAAHLVLEPQDGPRLGI